MSFSTFSLAAFLALEGLGLVTISLPSLGIKRWLRATLHAPFSCVPCTESASGADDGGWVPEKGLATWFKQHDTKWCAGVKVVAMDGFSGIKTAAISHLPTTQAVMDLFRVAQFAGQAIEE